MNKDVLNTLKDYKYKCKELENINDKLSSALTSAENKINKYKEVIDNALSVLRNELYKSRCRCNACNDYFIKKLIKLLE